MYIIPSITLIRTYRHIVWIIKMFIKQLWYYRICFERFTSNTESINQIKLVIILYMYIRLWKQWHPYENRLIVNFMVSKVIKKGQDSDDYATVHDFPANMDHHCFIRTPFGLKYSLRFNMLSACFVSYFLCILTHYAT